MSLRKPAVLVLAVALACVSGAIGDSRPGSILLATGSYESSGPVVESVPRLMTDDSSDRVEYSLEGQRGLDPAEISAGAKVCGALVAIAALVSFVISIRDRAFPYYR